MPYSLFFRQNLIHHPVLQRLLGGHPEVALAVGGDFLKRLAGVLGDDADLHPRELVKLVSIHCHIPKMHLIRS